MHPYGGMARMLSPAVTLKQNDCDAKNGCTSTWCMPIATMDIAGKDTGLAPNEVIGYTLTT